LFILKGLLTICPKPKDEVSAAERGVQHHSQVPIRQMTILLAKKIFESLASIQRSSGRSLSFDGRSRRVKVALIAGFLFGDAGTDRLSAFEAARGVEIRALFATMQLSIAARTLPGEVTIRREYSRARSASHHFTLSRHVRRLRSKPFFFLHGWTFSSFPGAP
jgi:hypothetical protein